MDEKVREEEETDARRLGRHQWAVHGTRKAVRSFQRQWREEARPHRPMPSQSAHEVVV